MGLFKTSKKEEKLNLDLDMPPEPPKIGIKGPGIIKEPIDEELMPKPKRQKKAPDFPPPVVEKEPNIPPLPSLDDKDFPELPSLDDIPDIGPAPPSLSTKKEDKLDIPPPPSPMKEKKPFFGFMKPKKGKAITVPVGEMPPFGEITDFGEEFPSPKPVEEKIDIPELPEEDFPSIPDFGKEFAEKPMFPPPTEKKIMPKIMSQKPHVEVQAPPIRAPPKETKKIDKVKFINIDDFKSIIGNINDIKRDIKDSSTIVHNFESIETNKEKKYEDWRNSLADMQRKILFVDKTLFKG